MTSISSIVSGNGDGGGSSSVVVTMVHCICYLCHHRNIGCIEKVV